MMTEIFQTIFARDLGRLSKEIEAYKEEAAIWKVEKQIRNSAGNLCLHLIGNLNTYIGRELGGTAYERNREGEFSDKDVPRADLLRRIEETSRIIKLAFDNLDEESLKEEYPVLVFEKKTSTAYLLTHLAAHLSYHLGQINYHRRLLDAGTAPLPKK